MKRYKFSWSPTGAMISLKNSAKFLENNEVYFISIFFFEK